jgi:hypothetical protein
MCRCFSVGGDGGSGLLEHSARRAGSTLTLCGAVRNVCCDRVGTEGRYIETAAAPVPPSTSAIACTTWPTLE